MSEIDNLCINTIRFLSVDAVEKAKSGHPGMPMGASTMAYTLWTKFLKHNPNNPEWINRDRFILSAGHGSMLLYSLLYLTGYKVTLEDLKQFRQFGSITPGHPEYRHTPGVETTTGPLGQGFATGVGIAISERILSNYFNRDGFNIIDYYTYAIVSDGDLMEGISHEAASLAGHLKLGKIVYLYDSNKITIEGSTNLSFTEDVEKRFLSYGWQVIKIDNGNNINEIESAIKLAQDEKERPSLIIVPTHIGFGSPNKQDTAEAHGSPLGTDETKLTKENLGWTYDSFYVPVEVFGHFKKALNKGKELEREWENLFNEYEKKFPELVIEFKKAFAQELPQGLLNNFPEFDISKEIATREASGKVINEIATKLKFLIGGSADLSPSNNTYINSSGDFSTENISGRNFHFGVREHAMGAILNGLALSKAIIPYGGTFLVFSDYMKPTIRLASMMKLRVIYVFTHDTIGLGEDGPTHQPIEQVAGLRAIPNLVVIRPADATEVVHAWRVAIERIDGPTALILTRQKLPVIDRTKFPPASLLTKGAYILFDSKKIDIILIASGSEVHLALESAKKIAEKGIGVRVVSMPSWQLFESQSEEYKNEVLPFEIEQRLAIEACSPLGWHKYVGLKGEVLGIERFGASGPYKILFEKFGFTVDSIVSKSISLLKQ